MNKALLLVFFLVAAIAAISFLAFYAIGGFQPKIPIGQAAQVGAAPPENSGIPFGAGIGIAMLLILSALAWYVPIGFGRKTRKPGKPE